jgi:hypothetical protein
MVLEICTNTIPQRDRPDYWRQVRENLFKDTCRITPDPESPFHASLSLLKVGPLTLSDCQGSSFRMTRQGCSERGSLSLLIQKEGECVIHHQDHETLLGPGRFCIFPANSPVEVEMRDAYRQLSLRLQAGALSERFPAGRNTPFPAFHATRVRAAFFSDWFWQCGSMGSPPTVNAALKPLKPCSACWSRHSANNP